MKQILLLAAIILGQVGSAAAAPVKADAHSFQELFEMLSPNKTDAKQLAAANELAMKAFPQSVDSASALLDNLETFKVKLDKVSLSESFGETSGFAESMSGENFIARNAETAIETLLQKSDAMKAFMEVCGVVESGGNYYQVCTRYEWQNGKWVAVRWTVTPVTSEP
ncbi:hypothetical protein C7S18_08655 [Ahniella affigens]|uniref:DUF4440 domain-containing protein n=1 Tax=Ahniella affigens TaxID=2021234 RepID=A0A2P1PQY8_9GAMM|nr:hypothetical protein [Ahniella affigens]AVP97259.1 hypothetical protein C7S18_08655 [Ahniella affigens]